MTRAHVFCIVAGIVGGQVSQALGPHPLWAIALVGAVAVVGVGWWARKELDW